MSELNLLQSELLDTFTLLSPVLYMYYRKSKHQVVLSIIPSIIKILFKLLNHIKLIRGRQEAIKKSSNRPEVKLCSINSSDGEINYDYLALSWWIQHNRDTLGINRLELYNYFTDCVKGKIHNNRGYFNLTDNKYTFTYNKVTYNINCVEIESKDANKQQQNIIYLQSDDIDDCYNLIKNAIVEYALFRESVKKSSGVRMITFYNRRLNSMDVNVTKTKENVFVEPYIDIFDQLDNFFSKDTYKLRELYGIPHKIGFLLYGVPGNGKTSLIYAISRHYKKDIYRINLDNDENLRYCMTVIETGSIVVFEDIDCCIAAQSRENSTDESALDKIKPKSNISLDTLLEILDGYQYLHECIIVMTSNYPEKLDSALIRPGRIDFSYKFNYVSKNLLKRIFKFYTGVELTEEQIDKYYRDNITTSELINQILLPNIKLSVDEILEKL